MNKEKISVSIIVPTYNDELYIKKCLDSLVKQSYENIEIIIIIDGATDGTYDIVKKYESDARVKVYFQENAGAGPARNNGINIARGEYLMFVDADDWLPHDAVKNFCNVLDVCEYDLIIGSNVYVQFKGGKVMEVAHKYGEIQIKDELEAKRYFFNQLGAVWGRIYKTSVIKSNNLRFPAMFRGQDAMFSRDLFKYIESMATIPNTTYYFRDPMFGEINNDINFQARRNESRYIDAQKDSLNVRKQLWYRFFQNIEDIDYPVTNDELVLKSNIEYSMILSAIRCNVSISSVIECKKWLKDLYSSDKFYNDVTINSRVKGCRACFIKKLIIAKKYGLVIILIKLKYKIWNIFQQI
ncbi:MAG: glycosyltransferase family A protein [Bacillota bacterium]